MANEQASNNDPIVPENKGSSFAKPQGSGADSSAGQAPKKLTPGKRFQIIRPHASGGLGHVFVAVDEELHREVALKEIQEPHADNPESRVRFLMEAEITGGLEHPGIVPVYGLGNYEDGRPYYAMRFIRGESLKEAINRFHKADEANMPPGQRTLALHALLDQFIDVCNAIEYAHSRRVLHRDLKPDNIMLGKYGETLVVDWGLAKPLEKERPSSAATKPGEGPLIPISQGPGSPKAEGEPLGTPQYMSPEQAAGRVDELDPATDIYGLGATLYYILTGQPPVRGTDRNSVLQKVQCGDFEKPRAVKGNVPAALEAVCLKAMQLQPSDRYPSARALADDIKHWLVDEPVTAWTEPFTDRCKRWARKHRTLVTSLLATLVVAGLVAIVAGIWIWFQYEDLARVNKNLAQANTELDQAKTTAEKNLDLALAAFDKTIDADLQLIDELKLPFALQCDAQLKIKIDNAKELYSAITKGNDENPQVQFRFARSQRRLGDIWRMRKEHARTLQSYEEAQSVLERLIRNFPEKEHFLVELGNVHRGLAHLHLSLPRKDGAEKVRVAFKQRNAIIEALAAKNALYQSEQILSLVDIAGFGIDTGTPEAYKEAEDALTKADALSDKLIGAKPGHLEAQFPRALLKADQALLYRRTGRADEAEAVQKESTRILETLAKDRRDTPRYEYYLGVALNNKGNLHLERDELEEALTVQNHALEVRSSLAEKYPAIVDFNFQVTITFVNTAAIYNDLGDLGQARKLYESAIKKRQQLVNAHPDVPGFRLGLGVAKGNLANVRRNMGDKAESKVLYGEAVDALRELIKKNPASPASAGVKKFLGDFLAFRAEAQTRWGEHDAALADWTDSVPLSAGVRLIDRKLQRAASLIRNGKVDEGMKETEDIKIDKKSRRNDLFEFARGYARLTAAVTENKSVPEDKRGQTVKMYSDVAISLLIRANELGYFRVPARLQGLKSDDAFRTLHARPEYQRIVDAQKGP